MQPRCPVCGEEVPADALACPRDGTPLEPALDEPTRRRDLLIGMKLGEYEILRRIGVGGMGIVYEGRQPVIGKRVAVKVLRPEIAESSEAVRRFLEEARTVNAIQHRGIVDIFSFGQVPDGRQYFVMEYLKGQPLDAVIAERAPMPPSDALPILDQLLEALGAIHRAGVIHRDLKPSNVFWIAEGNSKPYVKVLDFGLAKKSAFGQQGAKITQTSQIVGTPEFMAPEQARGDPLTGRVDLYAAGLIGFEMLTGRLPFQGGTPVEIMIAHVEKPPPRPSQFSRGIPAELDALLLWMLAKDPQQRPATAEVVRAKLRRIEAQLQVAVTPQIRLGESSDVHTDKIAPTVIKEVQIRDTDQVPARRPWSRPAIAGVLAACAVLGGTATFVFTRELDREGPPAAALPPLDAPAAEAPEPVAVAAPEAPAPVPVREAPPGRERPGVSHRAHRAAEARASPAGQPQEVVSPGTGRLILKVPPHNAASWLDVWIDGAPKGRTPVQVDLPPGVHQIKLQNLAAGVLIERAWVIRAGFVDDPVPWFLAPFPHAEGGPKLRDGP